MQPDKNNGGQRLLVAEANKMNREILAGRLAKQGYRVTTAEDGYLALGMLDIQDFDLVLADRDLPRVSGVELLKCMRRHPRLQNIPVILTTVQGDAECVAQALTLGAEDCLARPVNSVLLLARVASSLEKKRLRDQEVALRRELSLKIEQLGECVAQQLTPGSTSRSRIICLLATLVEARDPARAAHLERSRDYCELIARQLRSHPRFGSPIDDAYIADLRDAAPLHDIGQAQLPAAAWLKPDKLTGADWEQVRLHPTVGADTLRAIQRHHDDAFIRMAIDIVECHHEKWDGSGYPAGRRGRDIPLAARIFAVADAYDALTSKLCYRDARDHEQACGVIRAERGRHFDPEVVDAFLEAARQFPGVRNGYPVVRLTG